MEYHLTYRPAEPPVRYTDQIVSLIETDDPIDAILQSEIPDTITLMLLAHDMEEAMREIADLGFGY